MNTPELWNQVKATEERIAKTNNQLLVKHMRDIRDNSDGDEAWMLEDRADRELISFTQKSMQQRLSMARRSGKHSWWNSQRCEVNALRQLLYRALDEEDLVSVINYAAMIHARKIIDAQ
jgi:hypothetical protein